LATAKGTVNIDLQDIGFGKPTLNLGDGTGFALRAGWSRAFKAKSSLSLLLEYKRWDSERSDSLSIFNGVSTIAITEPESVSNSISLLMTYHHDL